jgi:hypothetical protein
MSDTGLDNGFRTVVRVHPVNESMHFHRDSFWSRSLIVNNFMPHRPPNTTCISLVLYLATSMAYSPLLPEGNRGRIKKHLNDSIHITGCWDETGCIDTKPASYQRTDLGEVQHLAFNLVGTNKFQRHCRKNSFVLKIKLQGQHSPQH